MTPIDVTELVVVRDRIADASVRSGAVAPADGSVLLEVERFALTSNNVTYAVMGDALQYWRFFPTGDEGRGIVPAWGVATVVSSEEPDIEVGERWYGYVPMASHLVVRPGKVTSAEVVDASPHREGLARAYQAYSRLDADPLHDPATLDLELLYRPLFTTSFLLAEVVAGEAGAPHEVVVITSASSKTGVALAHLLRDRDVTVVGLTSPSNVDHVTATGLYDRVLSYDEPDGLADLDGRGAVVDLAGRADVVAEVNDQLPDLATHLVVGVTHHDAGVTPRPPADGAPEPTMFFAPTHASTLAKAWGPAVLMQRIATAWRPFVTVVADEIEVVELAGLDAAAGAWRRTVDGDVDPGVGLVVTLGPTP